jgi:hypothetical protein
VKIGSSLRGKRRIMETLKYFTTISKYNLPKIPLKEIKLHPKI